MPKLVTALLIKDEADKYLEEVLRRCLSFSDSVLVLDDGSTDGSDRLAWRLGCQVKTRSETGMWGNEAPARAELWEWAAQEAGDGWVLICDGDMVLHGDPRPYTLSTSVNAWAWVLYDMWADRYFRCDGYWKGHCFPRPWMFRPNALRTPPQWPARGLHVGHCPANFPLQTGIIQDPEYFYIHRAYQTPELRAKKLEQYLNKAHLLTPFEIAHARSIGD